MNVQGQEVWMMESWGTSCRMTLIYVMWKWYMHMDKETSRNILWILCIDRARGNENTCYVLCVSLGWEVSILSINVCLLSMNSLTRYITLPLSITMSSSNLKMQVIIILQKIYFYIMYGIEPKILDVTAPTLRRLNFVHIKKIKFLP